MTKFFFATLAIAAFALPSNAGVLLPNLFAREFCSMRSMGVSEDESMAVAARASYVDGETIKVTIGGKVYDADVVQAMRAANERCPQFM